MADTYELDEAKNMVVAANGVTESQLNSWKNTNFGEGTKINNNGFYVVVKGMTAYESESLHIKNECGLSMVATWGNSIVSLYNESGKRIRGEWSTLSGSSKGTFKLEPGADQWLSTTLNSVIFVVWMYDLDL